MTPDYVELTVEDLAFDTRSRIPDHVILSIDDERVSDARLGRMIRRALAATAEPDEPVVAAAGNVVDLMAWRQGVDR